MRTTHTYALLEVSHNAWKEIKAKLLEAGYDHAINDEGEIDMHGIALVSDVCKDGCQYAKDVAMPEHSCANGCVYLKNCVVVL